MAAFDWSYSFDEELEPAPDETATGVIDLDLMPIRDLALDRVTGDLELPLRIVKGVEALAQRLRLRLLQWRGQWFLDETLGVPYAQQILGRRGTERVMLEVTLRRIILETVGIDSVRSFDVVFDRPGRAATITFEALAKGRVITFNGGVQP